MTTARLQAQQKTAKMVKPKGTNYIIKKSKINNEN